MTKPTGSINLEWRPPKRITGGPLAARDVCLISAIDLSGVDRGALDLYIALPEVKRDLIERALLPGLGLRKPERFTLGIA